MVAFVGQKGAAQSRQLYVRRLSQLQATPLSGTDNAVGPFFSPDGQWIAFFADGKLRKIAATGGPAVTLCDAPNARGGAWAEDGTIVFLPNQLGSLMRVSSDGGTPAPLLSLVEGEVTQRFPQVLPGGKAVLFTSSGTSAAFNDANLVVQALPTGTRTVVQRGGYHGRYLPSGHLVYLHDGTLFAAPFDLERLAVTGPPVSAVEGVASNEGMGSAQFAVSASGTLAYLPGQSTGGGVPIHWMDREGKTMPLRASRANWLNLLFAPDGQRLALEIFGEQADIWVFEWARDSLTRVTSDPRADTKPVWTPGGRSLVFASTRADASTPNLYWQRADGTGPAQRLTESKNPQQPASWHPSGTFLAFEEQHPTTKGDLMILTMEGDEASGWKPGKPTRVLEQPVRGARTNVLARRALDRILVDRIRTRRSVRAAVPWAGRTVADLDRGWQRSHVVADETRTPLHPQRPDHGCGFYGGGRRLPGREASAVVRRALPFPWAVSTGCLICIRTASGSRWRPVS